MYQILIPKNKNLLIFQNQKFKLWDYSKLNNLMEIWDNYADQQFALEWINYFTCRLNLILKNESDLELINCFGLKDVDTSELLLFWTYSVEFNSADKLNVSLYLILDIFSKEFLTNYKVSGIITQSTLPECRYYYSDNKLVFNKSNILYNEGFKFPLSKLDSQQIWVQDQTKRNTFLVKSPDVYGDKNEDPNTNNSYERWVYVDADTEWMQGFGVSFALAYIYYNDTETNNYNDVNLASDNIIKPFTPFFNIPYFLYLYEKMEDVDIDGEGSNDWKDTISTTYHGSITLDDGTNKIFLQETYHAFIMNCEKIGFNPARYSLVNNYTMCMLNDNISLNFQARDDYYFAFAWKGKTDTTAQAFNVYTKDKKLFQIMWSDDKECLNWLMNNMENNIIYIDDLIREIIDNNRNTEFINNYTWGTFTLYISQIITDGVQSIFDGQSSDYSDEMLIWEIWYPYFKGTSYNTKAIFAMEDLLWMFDYQVCTTYKFDISDDYDIKLTMSSLYNQLIVYSSYFKCELSNYDCVNSSEYMNIYFSEMLTFDFTNKMVITLKDEDDEFKNYNFFTDIYSYSMTKSSDYTNFLLTNSSQYMLSSVYAYNMKQQTEDLSGIMNDQAIYNIVMNSIGALANTGLSTVIGTAKFGKVGGAVSGGSSAISGIASIGNSVFQQGETQIQQQMNVLSAEYACDKLNAQRQDLQSNYTLQGNNSTLQYIQFAVANNLSLKEFSSNIYVLSLTLTDSIRDKVNWFFKLYGWKNGNQYEFDASVRKSPKFDYIQMDNIFISGCPKIWIDMICTIFKEGLWLINDETLEDINNLDFKENILYE